MSSEAKIQQWLAQLSPRSAAARRFVEFSKADVLIQQQQEQFDARTYCEAVLYLIQHLERRTRADQEAEAVNDAQQTINQYHEFMESTGGSL